MGESGKNPPSSSQESSVRKIAKPFVVLVERFYPDPFVFLIMLTAVVFVGAFTLTDATPVEAVQAWGSGLSGLLEFMAQIAIILIVSHVLAHTGPVRSGLDRLAALPKRPATAYGFVAFVAGAASLFSWALGLVVGALLARQIAIRAKASGTALHYPLLVASAYGGFVIWHMGYSSSAALFVATPGHALEEQLGGIVPVSETIFAGWNIGTAIVALCTVSLLMAAMKPRPDECVEINQAAIDDYHASMRELDSDASVDSHSGGKDGEGDAATLVATKPTVGERLDRNRALNTALGLGVAGYLVYWFATEGLSLDLNIVNWSILCLGLLLSRSTAQFVKLVANASRTVGQVIVQYPFYAGIMGLMIDTGLVRVIADWFIAISSASTLGFFAFLAGGVVNFFVPSGGGQWAVQGPIFIEAAQSLGTDPSRVVMGIAYGDQWSNMIQPFWTIPMLAIAGIPMRRVLGYTFVVFLVTFFIFGAGILLAGSG